MVQSKAFAKMVWWARAEIDPSVEKKAYGLRLANGRKETLFGRVRRNRIDLTTERQEDVCGCGCVGVGGCFHR